MMLKKGKNSGGFTLMEVLIVVAIIGILAAVVLTMSNSSRAKARNTRRTSDVKQLITAFSLGLATNNSLPSSGGGWACVSATCYGGNSGFGANGTVDTFLAPNITKPVDPADNTRGIGGYIYNSSVVLGGSFANGAYIMWYVEPPYNTKSCGIGTLRTNNSPVSIECVYKLD